MTSQFFAESHPAKIRNARGSAKAKILSSCVVYRRAINPYPNIDFWIEIAESYRRREE